MNFLTRLRDKIFGIDKMKYLLSIERLKQKEIMNFNRRELKAIEILKPYFPKGYLLDTGYSLSFQTIQHILNDIKIYEPSIVLEFGSGLSTEILNNFIVQNELKIRLISVDDDPNWQSQLKTTCKKVEFYNFPLVDSHPMSFQGKGFWFDIPKNHVLNNLKYDLVLVDAPKGSLSNLSRFGFIPFILDRLNDNSIVFLDDTDRTEEDTIAKLFVSKKTDKMRVQKHYNYTRFSNQDSYYTAPS